MPVAKIDPVETFYSVGSSLVGRILLFFSAGWAGLMLGRVAAEFRDWDDFLHPLDAFGNVWQGELIVEIMAVVFWPIVAVFATAGNSVLLFFIVAISVAVCFYLLVWTEEPAPLWWLILAAVMSAVPVFGGDSDLSIPPVLAWLIFLAGLGTFGWWVLRKYHPELIDAVENVVQGGLGESESPAMPRRKAPPGTWPEGVEGFEDEGENP